jgi:phage gp46-like protein
MPDIRLRESAIPLPPVSPAFTIGIDWAMGIESIDETQALATAIMVALGSDRLAAVSDVLPDNLSNDRRGWWGDIDALEVWNGWEVGTRLWTMQRDKITDAGSRFGATTAKAESFAKECIRPFKDQGFISNFTVQARKISKQRIDLSIMLMRTLAPDVRLEYQFLWDEIDRRVQPNAFVSEAISTTRR